MNRHTRVFRLTLWLATSSLTITGCFAGITPAWAQDAGTGPAGDPPARVGRFARLDGAVSTHAAGVTQWTQAVLNFPVVSGDAIWTQPRAQADIEVAASVATLADNTELDVATLDDHDLVATEPQGALFLDVRDLQPGDTYTINTPRGAVQIAAVGEYEILAGDVGTPTRVAVVRGAAQLTSGSLTLRAGQGEMAVATGDQDVQGTIEPLNSYDPFLTAMLARNSAPATAPPQVQDMTGAADLAHYGSWQDNPDYGQVWYPQVAPDWVPYRDGSWSYVAPWGWTWVDNEPWGFAPFHYGRWAQIGDRWCWVPGQDDAAEQSEPVYSPALVDFVVGGALAGGTAGLLAASLASGRGDVGWVPLGPREAYEPPYGGSRRYRERFNRGHDWHRASWDAGRDHRPGGDTRPFMNRHALTMTPVGVMARSQQIRPAAHGFDGAAARGLQPNGVQSLQGRLPIRPVAETRGLTPQAARRFGLGAGPARPPAPGPAINPAILRQGGVQGGRIPFRGGPAPAAAGVAPARAPGPPVQRPLPPRGPFTPQPPGRPAATLTPPPGPRPPIAAPEHRFPALRSPEAGRTLAPPPQSLPRVITPSPRPLPAAPRPAPAPIAPRLQAPGFTAPRVVAPRPPIISRPDVPRPFAPQMSAPLMARPGMARPGIGGPGIGGPGLAPQPHLAGPGRAPPPPPGRPPHP